ncbi:MAG: AAA family ATPase [Candidatus Lokiarchaeota archaeon]|nr:AAA family ATPase [Candidatus Lokiarchaeota archaeon]
MIELENSDFISSIYNLSQRNRRVISISGKSGTGKTTLALQLVSTILTGEKPYENSCVWIQASELFPKKRLISLFKTSPGKINYLLKNIFVIPRNKPFSNYKEQSTFFNELGTLLLPSNVKFIVIDNISHHLRLAASQNSDIKRRVILLNQFFSSQLFPLIMRCLRDNIILVLIHEVSFNPSSGKTQPFFNKLYSRIQTVNITLSKNFRSNKKTMEIDCGDNSNRRRLNYEIRDSGISLL